MARLQFGSVEEMFEKLTADEVMRAKRHSEAQAAKVQLELQDLVSQRYPDLLAGADTVLELTSRVSSMSGVLESIPRLCGELVTYQWNETESAHTRDNVVESSVVEAKFKDQESSQVVSLKWAQHPEQVRSALDVMQFSMALRLYLQNAWNEQKKKYILSYLNKEILLRARLFLSTFSLASYTSAFSDKKPPADIGAICVVTIFGGTVEKTLDFILEQRLKWLKDFLGNFKEATPIDAINETAVEIPQTSNRSSHVEPVGIERHARKRMKMLCARVLALADCVYATLSLIYRAFVQSDLANELNNILASLPSQGTETPKDASDSIKIRLSHTRYQIRKAIGFDKENGENFDNSNTIEFTAKSVSKWFGQVLLIVANNEDIFLPKDITSHDLVILRRYLLKFGANDVNSKSSTDVDAVGTSSMEWREICDGLGLKTEYPKLAMENCSTRQLLCSIMIEKMIYNRGSSLLSSAISRSASEFCTQVENMLKRIIETGSGVAALTGRRLSIGEGPNSNVKQKHIKRSGGFAKIREDAERNSSWSEEYAGELADSLTKKLSSLLQDNLLLSEGLLRSAPADTSSFKSSNGQIQEKIYTAFMDVQKFMSDFLNRICSSAQSYESSDRNILADQAYLIGSCANSMHNIQVLQIDEAISPKKLKRPLVKSLESIVEKSLDFWSKAVSKSCISCLRIGLGRMLSDDSVGRRHANNTNMNNSFQSLRYGWIKFNIGATSNMDTEDKVDQVDLPSTASPFVVQFLFSARSALFEASKGRWCGKNELAPAYVLSQRLLSDVSKVLSEPAVFGEVSKGDNAQKPNSGGCSEAAALQLILDIGVILGAFERDLSHSNLSRLHERLVSVIDPIEWTLYESLLTQVISLQVQRYRYFVMQRAEVEAAPVAVKARHGIESVLEVSDGEGSQNILKLAKMASRFPLLPVARVASRQASNSEDGGFYALDGGNHPSSPTASSPDASPMKSTYTASSLLSSITSGIWGE